MTTVAPSMQQLPGSVDLGEVARNELTGYELHRKKYLATHRRTTRPEPYSVKSLGWTFVAMSVQSVASIILAAMRTAKMFYVALSGAALNLAAISPIGLVEASAAVIAIEGGLVIYAIAREQRKYDRQLAGEPVGDNFLDRMVAKNPDMWLWIATITMVVISVSAGFGESLNLITDLNAGLLKAVQWILAVSLGAGASIVAYVSGEVLGYEMVRTRSLADKALQAFEEADNAFEDDMRRAWEESDELRVIRSAVDVAKEVAKNNVRSVRQSSKRTNEQRTNRGGNLIRREPVIKTKIFQYIERLVSEERRIPEVREIVEECKCGKATASEDRTEWMNANQQIVQELQNNGQA